MTQECGYDFDHILGVSGGSINAAYLAQAARGASPDEGLHNLAMYADGLCLVWQCAIQCESDVYSSRVGGKLWLALPRWLGGSAGLYDFSPLRALLKRYVSLPAIRHGGRMVSVGTFDLPSCQYIEWGPERDDFLDKVVASCSIPGAFAPVIDSEAGLALVDGGVRDVAPTRRAFDNSPEEVVILLTSPIRIGEDGLPEIDCDPQSFKDWTKPTVWQVLERTAGALCDEILVGDIRRAIAANDRLAGPGGDGYALATGKKQVSIKIMAPDKAHYQEGNCLEINPALIASRLAHGYELGAAGAWAWPLAD